MNPGDRIRLRAYGGEVIERRVVSETVNHVYVCKEEEYERAQRESREPVYVAFPKKSIVP